MRRTLLLLCVSALLIASCGSETDEGQDAQPTGVPQASAVPTATGSPTPSPSPEIRTDYDLPPYKDLVRLFDYDASEPLGYEVLSSERERGATVHQVTYQSSGYEVPAYLVLPDGDEPFPAVLYAHGQSVGPSWFLPDAIALAQEGYAGLLIRYPGDREPYVSFTSCDAETDREGSVQYAIDLRRGLDLLASLPEIDAERIGLLGHSLGAGVVGILTGVESERVDAFVIMDGGAYTSEELMVDCGPKLVEEDRIAYQEGIAVLNPANYIGHSRGAALMFQLSTDSPSARVRRGPTEMMLVELAPEPKTFIEYEEYDHLFGCLELTLCDPSLPPYVDHREWLQENV